MAYDTFLYVDQKNGDDANSGLSPTLAKATIQGAADVSEADAVEAKYSIFILGGTYNENVLGVIQNSLSYGIRFVGLFNTKISQSVSTGTLYFRLGVHEVHNIEFIGTSYPYYYNTDYSSEVIKSYNCIFNGNFHAGRGWSKQFYNCEFRNGSFVWTTNGILTDIPLGHLENCSFINFNAIFLVGTNPSALKEVFDCVFKNSEITISSNYTTSYFKSNILDNCEVRFTSTFTYLTIPESYLLVNSVAEMQSKADTDLGVSAITIINNDFDFDTIDFLDEANDNLFLASKNLYQYNSDRPNLRHIGVNRYAIYLDSTQMTPPANGSVANGYAESTAAPSTGIEFICDAIEFTKAKIIKRAYAIVDIGNGGEIMSSQVEDVNKRIIDVDLSISATKTAAQLDASPEAYVNYEIGIVDTSLNYDNINVVAKSVKPKFTLKNEGASTDFGEVKVYQIIIETEDILTFENYTDYELKQISGNSQNCKDYTGSGDWIAPNELDINPNNEPLVQALIDAVSGKPAGTTEYTIDEIMAMNAASADLTGVFAEALGVAGISGDDLQTQYARTETTAGTPEKTIHTFEII